MRHRELHFAAAFVLVVAAFTACTTPNPNYRKPGSDAGVNGDGGGGSCEAGAALRCDGTNLVRCKPEGAGEVSEPCALGCNAAALRCFDANPSNGLAKFLDQASGQPDLNLGDSATINTDTGEVKVGGSVVTVYSESVAQPNGPVVRVFAVKSLVAKDVVVTGKNAIAMVSAGDIKISGVFAASANGAGPGAGAFADGNCRGKDSPFKQACIGGAGGGGFGSPGGGGGSAKDPVAYADGGTGGTIAGNAELVPLRGGCGGGDTYDGTRGGGGGGGGGGGAIHLVARTEVSVSGVLAANGGTGPGGGSGGGILLEAPIIDVAGRVVANGAGGGSGLGPGREDGRLDATPASGSAARADDGEFGAIRSAQSGSGGAGSIAAENGRNIIAPDGFATFGGGGGGGVGRIRVNTASGGIRGGGVFSPPPSTGTLATR
jgi:hypothetical protein